MWGTYITYIVSLLISESSPKICFDPHRLNLCQSLIIRRHWLKGAVVTSVEKALLRKLLQPMRSHHTRGVVALLALTVSYRSSVRAVRLYAWHCMSKSSLRCAIVLLRVAEQHLGFLSLFMDLRQSILILARLPLKYLARFHARSWLSVPYRLAP